MSQISEYGTHSEEKLTIEQLRIAKQTHCLKAHPDNNEEICEICEICEKLEDRIVALEGGLED